jgi:hypothetical protein
MHCEHPAVQEGKSRKNFALVGLNAPTTFCICSTMIGLLINLVVLRNQCKVKNVQGSACMHLVVYKFGITIPAGYKGSVDVCGREASASSFFRTMRVQCELCLVEKRRFLLLVDV